jgi:hypothetical protein
LPGGAQNLPIWNLCGAVMCGANAGSSLAVSPMIA